MQSQSYDFYAGLVQPQSVYATDEILVFNEKAPANQKKPLPQEAIKQLPVDCHTIEEILLSISSFGARDSYDGLHVGVWLSQEEFVQKESADVMAFANTGSSGSANVFHSNLNLAAISPYLVFNFWSHNMFPVPMDWHTNAVIYYEP